MVHEQITEKIIRAFFRVYNTLGHGFLEKVYENAMRFELEAMTCSVRQQYNIKVHYRGQVVGEYYADLLIDELVLVELKAAESLSEAREAQLIHYLKATDIEVGLLLNFGKKAEFRRKIFTNDQ